MQSENFLFVVYFSHLPVFPYKNLRSCTESLALSEYRKKREVCVHINEFEGYKNVCRPPSASDLSARRIANTLPAPTLTLQHTPLVDPSMPSHLLTLGVQQTHWQQQKHGTFVTSSTERGDPNSSQQCHMSICPQPQMQCVKDTNKPI
jgi:hypothetical protein